jgi:hypothetical protein
MYIDNGRTIPVDRTNPVIAALISKLESAQAEMAQCAQIAADKMAVVQEVIHRAIRFANVTDLDESDPKVTPILAELRVARQHSHEAATITTQRLHVVVDILGQIESAARNQCLSFN